MSVHVFIDYVHIYRYYPEFWFWLTFNILELGFQVHSEKLKKVLGQEHNVKTLRSLRTVYFLRYCVLSSGRVQYSTPHFTLLPANENNIYLQVEIKFTTVLLINYRNTLKKPIKIHIKWINYNPAGLGQRFREIFSNDPKRRIATFSKAN